MNIGILLLDIYFLRIEVGLENIRGNARPRKLRKPRKVDATAVVLGHRFVEFVFVR